jgi:hypothetical protein
MAKLKKREQTWANRYMPLLRTITYGKARRLWETPQNFVQDNLKIGKLLNSLRSGDRTISQTYQSELEFLGFDRRKSFHVSKFENDYLPAFRDSVFGKSKRLWETPQIHMHNGVKVGRILNHLRSFRMVLDVHTIEQLNSLGYNNGKSLSESRFEVDVMNAFRKSVFGQQKRVWEIPQNFAFELIKIGRVLNHLRSGNIEVPVSCRQELEILGYNNGQGFHESRFLLDYMPALRDCKYGQEKRLCDAPLEFTYHGISVGKLMNRNDLTIPDIHRLELKHLGYKQTL